MERKNAGFMQNIHHSFVFRPYILLLDVLPATCQRKNINLKKSFKYERQYNVGLLFIFQ
jgi:hypothetical protein